MKNHLEAGGKLVTAWTPITDARKEEWLAMRQVWLMLDGIVEKFAKPDQLIVTACNKVYSVDVLLHKS
ncbi:hypothetical protein ANCDUO_11593 [Ancylostoma duodenale]|uniref:Uncharacterized protein n=1 Tax=Ancylostoma duodenale TaxID=51022 RepID=A0A0C2D7S9_9BILA|nr:hypothetical protein ANCDUO_11593 [Ancylostoma duodenale]